MGGRTKIWDQAADAQGELRRLMRREFLCDGVIEPWEDELLGLADEACAYTNAANAFMKAGIRWFGGGDVVGDEGLMGRVREADAMLDAVRKKASPPGLTSGLVEVERDSEAA